MTVAVGGGEGTRGGCVTTPYIQYIYSSAAPHSPVDMVLCSDTPDKVSQRTQYALLENLVNTLMTKIFKFFH